MTPQRKSAATVLREFIEAAESDPTPMWEARCHEARLALAALLSERQMKPSGTPADVVRFIAAARQLASAVEYGSVSERNKAQARNLSLKGKAVADAVDAWTDGGRREPMSGACEKVET